MMNCKDIEYNLPLYEDDVLSNEEKQAVEQHLKSCSKCAKTLAQLQKTGRLVGELAEAEPPPWFKQKIMSRVREEAAKKSLAQKWFYPLRIKIPVQIMAAIVVAVIGVYIYRSGDEQMKVVLPPTQVMETKKDLFSEQTTKLSEADKTVDKKKVYIPGGAQNENIVPQDLPADSGASPAGAEGSFPKRDIPRLAESIQPPAEAGGFLQRGKRRIVSIVRTKACS